MSDFSSFLKKRNTVFRSFTFFCLFFLTSILLASCRAPDHPRFLQSGHNTTFDFKESSFAAYIGQTREMIEKTRFDLDGQNRDQIIDANSPFELLPDEHFFPRLADGRFARGVLLIHGLADSPYVMRPLARHLQARGFLVRALLLPGHGTCPGDLAKVEREEWIKAVEYGAAGLSGQVQNLYMGGYSTGAALCIDYAYHHSDVFGLFLFAPALTIKTNWVHLTPFVGNFTDWLLIHDDEDYSRYESFSVNSAFQVYALTQRIDKLRSGKKGLVMPIFVVAGMEDMVIDARKTVEFFSKESASEKSFLLLYSRSPDSVAVNDQRIRVVNSHLEEERIHDFSHLGVTIPANDPHYGRQGDYRHCLHYDEGSAQHQACLSDDLVWQGEATWKNRRAGVVRRLTYNPLFQGMLVHLDCFLVSLEP